MKQLFQKHAPMGLVFILALAVIIETGFLISGLIYYDTLSSLQDQTVGLSKNQNINKKIKTNLAYIPTLSSVKLNSLTPTINPDKNSLTKYKMFIDQKLSMEIPDNWVVVVKQGVPEGGTPPRDYSFYVEDITNSSLHYPVGLNISIDTVGPEDTKDQGYNIEKVYDTFKKETSTCIKINGENPIITTINISGYIGEKCLIPNYPYIGEFEEIVAKKGTSFFFLTTIGKNEYYGQKNIADKEMERVINSIILN